MKASVLMRNPRRSRRTANCMTLSESESTKTKDCPRRRVFGQAHGCGAHGADEPRELPLVRARDDQRQLTKLFPGTKARLDATAILVQLPWASPSIQQELQKVPTAQP